MLERTGGHPERRRQILDAALRVFSERGFGGASIRRISDEAGLNSPPLVYWYFESKQDLFAATLARFSERITGFASEEDMERPPEDLLPELALAELRAYGDQMLVRLLRVGVAESALDPAFGERFFVVFRGEVLDFLTRYLELWAERSGLGDFRAETEARAFLGALFFYVLNREVLPGFGGEIPDQNEYADAVARRLLDRFEGSDQRTPKHLVLPVLARPSIEAPDDVLAGPQEGEKLSEPASITDDGGLPELERVETEARVEREAGMVETPRFEQPSSAGELVGGSSAGRLEENEVAGVVGSSPEPVDSEEEAFPDELDAEREFESFEGPEPERTDVLGPPERDDGVEAGGREEPGERRAPGDQRWRAVGTTGDGETEEAAETFTADDSGERRREEQTASIFDELSRDTPALVPLSGTLPNLPPRPEIPFFDPATARAERAARKRSAGSEDPLEAATGDAGPEDKPSESRPPWVARGERLRDLEDRRLSEPETPGAEVPGEPEQSVERTGPSEPAELVEHMGGQETPADLEAPPGVPSGVELGIGGGDASSEPRQPSSAGPLAPTERSASGGVSGTRGAAADGVRKVLFFVLPVRGHVQAALPAARELASRGEEVIFYTTEEFRGLVRGAGVGYRELGEDFALPEELSEGYLAATRDLRPAIIRSIADSLRGVGWLAGLAAEERADYAVYDPLCPWGRLIPEALGLPLVALYSTFVARENSPLARRLLPNLDGAPPPALVMPMVRLRWELREVRSTLGLSRLRPADLLLQSADLNIVTLPDRFQPPTGGTIDGRFLFVGPSILQRDERAYFSLKQIEAQPTVFVSLGAASDERTAELYQDCLEAFASSRWLVIMETGAGTDPSLLGQAPPNVIAWPRVPRLEVLRRCDVFVTDGDVGATMEALWFGVPLVVVPRTPEHSVTAERVRELQMGIILDRGATGADALREAVDVVGAEPSNHAGLADLWVAARHAGGHRLAADRIQSFVGSAQAAP